MQLKSCFDPLKAAPAHDGTILSSPVLPKEVTTPFKHRWGYLPKPGTMDAHKHHEREFYMFLQGKGIVLIDGQEIPVQSGDVIYVPEDALHTVINQENSGLLWAAFWWQD